MSLKQNGACRTREFPQIVETNELEDVVIARFVGYVLGINLEMEEVTDEQGRGEDDGGAELGHPS